MSNNVVCFIGAGKMASAIASGLHKKDSSFSIRAYDPSAAACENFKKVSGGEVFSSAKEALSGAEIVVLAVKPQYLAEAVQGLESDFAGKLVLSIVAGTNLQKLEKLTGTTRLIRIMPNTPALVGAGMSCLAPNAGLSESDVAMGLQIFESVGRAQVISEKLLNAVTGLSGSGPAYVLDFIMALADGGVHEGLPRTVALELAMQTVYGTAKLAMESGRHPALLRDDVISPGGTTARGMMALSEGGFEAASAKAVIAAAEFSAQLAKL